MLVLKSLQISSLRFKESNFKKIWTPFIKFNKDTEGWTKKSWILPLHSSNPDLKNSRITVHHGWKIWYEGRMRCVTISKKISTINVPCGVMDDRKISTKLQVSIWCNGCWGKLIVMLFHCPLYNLQGGTFMDIIYGYNLWI